MRDTIDMAGGDSKRWYDGRLYASVFDPSETEKRRTIGDFIRPDSTVIDIACGTGALVFYLANSRRHVTCLELSSTMHRFTTFKKQKIGPARSKPFLQSQNVRSHFKTSDQVRGQGADR